MSATTQQQQQSLTLIRSSITSNNTNTNIATPKPSQITKQTHLLWQAQFKSALRTALACMIVGIATIYGPVGLRRHISFPAFSYVTSVLVIGEATSLGEVLHGCMSAIYGTALGALPAMLTLFLIKSQGFWIVTATLAASISSFVVAIPESTSLIAKRIAFGQIVIIYVATTDYQAIGLGSGKAIMHPVNAAASTALGVVASLIAMMFPYPQLACHEVSKKSKMYKNMAMLRLRLLLNAFSAENKTCASSFISQATCLKSTSNKLLHIVKQRQVSLEWEKPSKFFGNSSREQLQHLQATETAMQGMELSLNSITKLPQKFSSQEFKQNMINIANHISLKLLDTDHFFTNQAEIFNQILQHITSMPHTLTELPCYFFIFCMHLFCIDELSVPETMQDKRILPTTESPEHSCTTEESNSSNDDDDDDSKVKAKTISCFNLRAERFVVAFKCSLTIGLAALLGLLFSKEYGFWSALPIAVTMCPWRESTFKLANARAQGTALGSVYGVLGGLISQNIMGFRFFVLLPWIIFTSLLRRSRMYGPAGAISAMISGLLIVGRRNYGTPAFFTISRLTETFIGLTCSIIVELLLQPMRASVIAREQLSHSLAMLTECISQCSAVPSKSSVSVKELKQKLRIQMDTLKKYIGEAAAEPNFWFLPFPVSSYNRIHASMSKVMDLHVFMLKSMELLLEETCGLAEACNHVVEAIEGDLAQFRKLVGSSVKCFENVIQVKSLANLDAELRKQTSVDIEIGSINLTANAEQAEHLVSLFLQHAKQVTDRLETEICDNSKGQLVLYLATIGFCIAEMMKECRVIENGILELVQSENPDCHINLHQISCKLEVLARRQ